MEDIYETEKLEELTLKYKNLKSNEITNVHIEYINKVSIYNKQLTEQKNLYWIQNISGITVDLLPFSDLNFKLLLNLYDYLEKDKILSFHELVSLILKKELSFCKSIYELIVTPDIDIKQLSTIILDNIDNFRKEVSRCDRAFDKITEALRTLESKFSNYYKDYVASNDPSIMIQSFLSDIYQDNKEDVMLVYQLKKIISYFSSKIKSHQNSNPTINNIVDKLMNMFSSKTEEEK
jgi:hypothetical protein